jgi:ERCC4-related helicase
MTNRMRKADPLADVVRSQLEEIKKYKWIESEKAGKDIGMERATREWMAKHFPEWKRYRWMQVVNEAMRADSRWN